MIRWFERHNKISASITLVIAVMIYYISSLPGGSGGVPSNPWLPTAYHILAFFFLAAFMMLTVIRGKHKQYFIPTLLLAFLYAISDEFHQLFVPGRAFSVGDILLDGLGIVLAFILYSAMLKARND